MTRSECRHFRHKERIPRSCARRKWSKIIVRTEVTRRSEMYTRESKSDTPISMVDLDERRMRQFSKDVKE